MCGKPAHSPGDPEVSEPRWAAEETGRVEVAVRAGAADRVVERAAPARGVAAAGAPAPARVARSVPVRSLRSSTSPPLLVARPKRPWIHDHSLSVNSVAIELVRAAPWTSWIARRSPDPSPPRRADGRYVHRVPGAIATHHGARTRCPQRRFDSPSWPHPSEPAPCSRSWPRSPPRCPRNVPAPVGLP